MQGLVYNSFYKSIRLPDVAASNLFHFKYITCKYKEVTFNKGCDFSLWGKFPGLSCGDVNDFDLACKTITEVSSRRTIYRGVLSLDGETADYKNMNDRAAWQNMTEKRMYIIAKEYDIKPENFCWAASFHFKEGHPHTHIMFWDNSDDVRDEFIPFARFEVATDKIREGFNKDIFSEELHQLYKKQDELKISFKQQFNTTLKIISASMQNKDAEAQEQLRLLFQEDNFFNGQVVNTLNTFNLNDDKLALLTNRILLIYNSLPQKGSFDYKFLSPQIKSEVNAAIDALLDAVPQYKNQYEALLKSADAISDIYDNRVKGKEHHREGLKHKFYTDTGNQILKWIVANKDSVLNADSRIKALSSIVAIKNTTTKVFEDMLLAAPIKEIERPQPYYKEDLHIMSDEEDTIMSLSETEEKQAEVIFKTNTLQKLADAFPKKYVSAQKLFSDERFTKLFNSAVNEIVQTSQVKAAVADYSVSDRLEYKQRLLKDLRITLPNDYTDEELEQFAVEMLSNEKTLHCEEIEKRKILSYCKKEFSELNEEQILEKANQIYKNQEFAEIRKSIGIPIKQSDYFKQQSDAYKLVRQTVLDELKNLNKWDEQFTVDNEAWQHRQEEWARRQEQYQKEMYANLAIRLVVDFSRLFKSENWQRYKGALALSKDKNLIDRKNIRATLKQKAVFEWKDEFER